MNTTLCQCGSECQNKRCHCFKAGKPCSAQCRCQNCKNPFNQLDDAQLLSDCARGHIKSVAALTDAQLSLQYLLLCGCESASLKDLLQPHDCGKCGERYYYSFCFNDLADSASLWHCSICGNCSDDATWHCKRCNRCSYGLSLSCDNCGKKSPYRI